MPRYRYTGDHPLILTGLAVGTNATVTRPGAEDEIPAGTVVAEPGDLIETQEPYEHALLEVLDAPAGEDEAPAEEHAPEPDEAPKAPATKRKTAPTPAAEPETQE